MRRVALSLFAFLTLGLVACTAADNVPPASAPQVITLDAQASQLRSDFNASKGSVRLLLIVDPACAVCLRGFDDVNGSLLAKLTDPRLQTFVVHTSVIGGSVDDVAPASELLHNAHVRHYWDPSGDFGRQVSESLQLKRGNAVVYAWDVWMIYDDTALMSEKDVPQPTLFMHQLPGLRGQTDRPFLDSDVFAARARELLAQLPAVPATDK